jgi:NHL repeat
VRQIFRCVCAYLTLLIVPAAAQYTISTIAGGMSADGLAATSRFISNPNIALDPSGNLYFVLTGEARVYKLKPNGTLTLVAGNGSPGFSGDNGPATAASLIPYALAVDAAGNVYIADGPTNRVRKVSNGIITTIAGNGSGTSSGDNGPATSAGFSSVQGLALDSSSNLYIADNASVRKVTNGTITTVAGNNQLGAGFSGDNGPAVNAQLNLPQSIAVDGAGNLYIADVNNQRVRKVSGGTITTIAGAGNSGSPGDNIPAISAYIYPAGIAMDTTGTNLYISDGVARIRKVTGGIASTVAGTGIAGFNGDGLGPTGTQLQSPGSLAVDGSGTLYVGDNGNNRIRKVSSNVVTTVVGGGSSGDGGPAVNAGLLGPRGVTVDASGNIYIADSGSNRLRKITNGAISTVAGNGMGSDSGDNGPAASATLAYPGKLTVDNSGNIYIAGNAVIRKIANGVITTVAGNGTIGFSGDNGPATSAQLSSPGGAAVDGQGNLYITDTNNLRIRKVSNGVITTIAGNGLQSFPGYNGDNGPATNAQLAFPEGISLDGAGNLYFADNIDSRIRKIAGGTITTLAGGGTVLGDGGVPLSAALKQPEDVILDSSGDILIADSLNHRIRMVSGGVIATIAGNGSPGYSGDGGPAANAQINHPSQLARDSSGNIYFTDRNNNAIRVLTPVPINPPPNCSYTVTPVTSQTFSSNNLSLSFGSAGGDAMFLVTTAAGCPWNAVTSASFITLTGGGSISGSRQVAYSVAPNMTTSARTGTIAIAGQTFSVSQSAGDILSCPGNAGNPVIARVEGLADLLDFTLPCTVLPPGGIKADLQAFFNTNVTSRLLSGGNNSSEALLLVNLPDSPVLGTNAFLGQQVSSNSVLFSQVQLPATNSPQQVFLSLANVRLNMAVLGLSSGFVPTEATGFLTSNTGSGPALVNNSLNVVAFVQPGMYPTRGTAAPGPDPSTQLGFPLNFREGFANVFRPLFGTCLYGPPICPTTGQDPSRAGVAYNSESGFLNSNVFGPVVGFADTSTRVLARFTNIPSGLRLFASIFRNAIVQRCAPIVAAQLVSADNNGAGGTFISPVNQETYHEIAVVNGAASATWEITSSDPACVDTLQTFVYFQGVSQPPSQAQLNQIAVKVNLAPLSTVGTSSTTAPLPRFVDFDSTLPPCPTCVPLTLGTNPPGLPLMADGTLVSPQNVAQQVVPGLTHLLSVDPNSHASSGQPYRFTGWSNGVATPSQTLVVNGPTAITANFAATGIGILVTHSGNFAPGQNGAIYRVTVNNFAGGPATTGPVTVTEVPPAGLTLTGMSGTGWSCSGNTCTRSDALSPGSSYPVISVTMNVSPTATSPQVNLVSVSGGGSATVNFSDPTTIVTPTISLSRKVLNFAVSNSATTSPQQVDVNFSSGGAVNWTASSSPINIILTFPSGTGNGSFFVSSLGPPSGTVTVTAPGAANSPQTIQVNAALLNPPGTPFGSFDTPVDNTSGVVGAIPVTGWALDNIEVANVDVWREPVTGEPAGNLIFIGNAVFVADARPDVQAMYSTYPFSYRAGWGYQMLTNFLPNSSGSGAPGNGTYKIHAIAHSKTGAQVDLGTKTIVVDNAHAAKPFGTLDTPAQGGTVSGSDYVNFGWALTPQPSTIPIDGSTITLVLDGALSVHPTYNQFRSDIASLFPGYANSMGAVGFIHLDTRTLANGVHTISWNAFDSAGHGEGLGSRYLNVLNTGGGSEAAPEDVIPESATHEGVQVRHGLEINRRPVEPDADGGYSVSMEEVGRIELHLGAARGNMLVLDEVHALPIGSTLKGGVFYWQPGPGFLGEYRLQFERPDGTKIPVRVSIVPKRFP